MAEHYTLEQGGFVAGNLITIKTIVGPDGNEQEGSFQNATLQSDASFTVDYSIAMYVRIDATKLTNLRPEARLYNGGSVGPVDQLADYLHSLLLHLSSQAPDGNVHFEAEVGPSTANG